MDENYDMILAYFAISKIFELDGNPSILNCTYEYGSFPLETPPELYSLMQKMLQMKFEGKLNNYNIQDRLKMADHADELRWILTYKLDSGLIKKDCFKRALRILIPILTAFPSAGNNWHMYNVCVGT